MKSWYPTWGVPLMLFTLFGVSGCRKDTPPMPDPICTLDGFGGGDCAHPTGETLYKSPSEMKNSWAISQEDASNLVAWCYKTTPEQVKPQLNKIQARLQKGASHVDSDVRL